MKNKNIFPFALYFALATVLFSCNSSNEIDDTNVASHSIVTKNFYLEKAEQELSEFDIAFDSSLVSAKTFEELESNLNDQIGDEQSILKSKFSDISSVVLTGLEAEIINSKLNSIQQIANAFDSINCTGSKNEFIVYLTDMEKQFRIEANSLNNLSDEKKQILIANAAIEFGILKILSSNSDEIDALVNKQNVSPKSKSAASCDWWCRNKRRIECIGLTAATGGLIYVTATSCPKCFLLLASTAMLTFDCWKYL